MLGKNYVNENKSQSSSYCIVFFNVYYPFLFVEICFSSRRNCDRKILSVLKCNVHDDAYPYYFNQQSSSGIFRFISDWFDLIKIRFNVFNQEKIKL